MRKFPFPGLAIAACLIVGAPALTFAQATNDISTQPMAQPVDRDEGSDWGWLGLIGLAGLLGLKRREPDVVRRDVPVSTR